MHRRLPAAAVALGVLAVSCGVTTAVTTGTASATTSNAPIVVGGDGDLLSPGIPQGFQAGIYRFNKAGGLNGRKIKF